MKILLISPCIDDETRSRKTMLMPQLALFILAGLTPPEHLVTIVEEEIEPIPMDLDCDLVGLSCMTSNAPRAYALAGEFKKRGKAVVLGGVHPTILPEEALQHADSVVIGEAEGVWPQLLDDYGKGRLQRTYHNPCPPLDKYVPIRCHKGLKKGLFRIIPVMTTRGCPYDCDFCCVHDIYGPKVRHVPVENVIRYLIESGGKRFMFLDDNIVGDPRYAKDLFRAMKPLRIKWVGQASLSFACDTELLRLAADSGCGGLFIGLESVSESRLGKMRKSLNKVEELEKAVKELMSFGIILMASVIFGFDEDTTGTFGETLEFLNRNRIGTAQFNILTPYPGTRTYRQLKDENRLLTEDWKYYDHTSVVYRPGRMTPSELALGRLRTREEFTRISSIIRRFPYNLGHPLFYLALNVHSRRICKEEIRGYPRYAARLSCLEAQKPGPKVTVHFNVHY
jgi:radical SAM superfamily enzyme YgiQ (UPF0313 family)